jgi:hypothetical protein
MPYLNIVYLDGEQESVFVGDDAMITLKDGQLLVRGGDGSCRERGKLEGWPMERVRRWWTSDGP